MVKVNKRSSVCNLARSPPTQRVVLATPIFQPGHPKEWEAFLRPFGTPCFNMTLHGVGYAAEVLHMDQDGFLFNSDGVRVPSRTKPSDFGFVDVDNCLLFLVAADGTIDLQLDDGRVAKLDLGSVHHQTGHDQFRTAADDDSIRSGVQHDGAGASPQLAHQTGAAARVGAGQPSTDAPRALDENGSPSLQQHNPARRRLGGGSAGARKPSRIVVKRLRPVRVKPRQTTAAAASLTTSGRLLLGTAVRQIFCQNGRLLGRVKTLVLGRHAATNPGLAQQINNNNNNIINNNSKQLPAP